MRRRWANLRAATWLSGGLLLFVSMTVVNGGNYLFNLVLGRWLGPAAFADMSLIVTLMLMVTLATATLQLVAARFSAGAAAAGTTAAEQVVLQRWLERAAWVVGVAAAVLMIAGAGFWQRFFQTASPWPFVIFGVGVPVYLVQGVGRGMLQGEVRFGRLALSYQVEMWVRLGFGLLFVALGGSVNGAVAAITLSFIASWWLVRRSVAGPGDAGLSAALRRRITAYAGPVTMLQLGQILINNSDILIVKRYFAAEEAGLYAALALIGRVVFFATWSVVNTQFPIVAQKHQRGEPHRHLLWGGLAIVAGMSGMILVATYFLPELIVRLLFGEAFLAIAPLLWLYATATMVYALANVVVSYRLSADASFGALLTVIGGVAQVVLLILFHASLAQVVLVQIGLMSGLLVTLLIWDGWVAQRERRAHVAPAVTIDHVQARSVEW